MLCLFFYLYPILNLKKKNCILICINPLCFLWFFVLTHNFYSVWLSPMWVMACQKSRIPGNVINRRWGKLSLFVNWGDNLKCSNSWAVMYDKWQVLAFTYLLISFWRIVFFTSSLSYEDTGTQDECPAALVFTAVTNDLFVSSQRKSCSGEF